MWGRIGDDNGDECGDECGDSFTVVIQPARPQTTAKYTRSKFSTYLTHSVFQHDYNLSHLKVSQSIEYLVKRYI